MIGDRCFFYISLLVVSILAGCSITIEPNDDSPWYAVPAGSTLTLHQDLEVPADHARVFIQKGHVVSGASPFATHCAFEVKDVFPHPQTIQADQFTIRKVTRDTQNVVQSQRVMLASTTVAGMNGSNGGSDETKMWHLWLSSATQHFVLRITCGGIFEQPARSEFPTINEIRATLGEIATLVLAGPENTR